MKRFLNKFYWSLPVLFALLWLLITLLFTPIHDNIIASLPAEFFQERHIQGPSPRMGLIVFSPLIMLAFSIWLYIILYIERKLIYNWKIIIGINALLLIVCMTDVAETIYYAYTDKSEYAEWRYYCALEDFLKYAPFILVSFFTLSHIRKCLITKFGEKKNDINYVLFYLLPILYICYVAILGYVLSGITKLTMEANSALCENVGNLSIDALFIMPVCVFILWLYKKLGTNKYVSYCITAISTIVMIASWYLSNDNGRYTESVTFSIVMLCLEVLPWTIASHYIGTKFMERNRLIEICGTQS